jgi:hypothetical protein
VKDWLSALRDKGQNFGRRQKSLAVGSGRTFGKADGCGCGALGTWVGETNSIRLTDRVSSSAPLREKGFAFSFDGSISAFAWLGELSFDSIHISYALLNAVLDTQSPPVSSCFA